MTDFWYGFATGSAVTFFFCWSLLAKWRAEWKAMDDLVRTQKELIADLQDPRFSKKAS